MSLRFAVEVRQYVAYLKRSGNIVTSEGISCDPTKIYHVSSIRKWTRLGRLLKRTSSTVDLVTINKRKESFIADVSVFWIWSASIGLLQAQFILIHANWEL